MADSGDYRRGRHVVSALHVHLVFVTKYRRKVLTGSMIEYLSGVFGKVCEDFGADLAECNGEDDHVHLLIEYPPKVPVSVLVNSLKGVSSRKLRERYTVRTHRDHLWSPSYFAASCGPAPLDIIRQYVENQRAPGG
ncbi:MAG: IS200/IS605 family transposase [Streptosporangiaceae bacterium]